MLHSKARTKATGVDWVSEKKVAGPAVEMYTGGFECQDLTGKSWNKFGLFGLWAIEVMMNADT